MSTTPHAPAELEYSFLFQSHYFHSPASNLKLYGNTRLHQTSYHSPNEVISHSMTWKTPSLPLYISITFVYRFFLSWLCNTQLLTYLCLWSRGKISFGARKGTGSCTGYCPRVSKKTSFDLSLLSFFSGDLPSAYLYTHGSTVAKVSLLSSLIDNRFQKDKHAQSFFSSDRFKFPNIGIAI